MDSSIEYLISYLQDEFRDAPQVRIRPVQPTGTQRALDLEQDYDPSSQSLHLRRGVSVRIRSREYYFPAEWVASGRFQEISKLASEIRAMLD